MSKELDTKFNLEEYPYLEEYEMDSNEADLTNSIQKLSTKDSNFIPESIINQNPKKYSYKSLIKAYKNTLRNITRKFNNYFS